MYDFCKILSTSTAASLPSRWKCVHISFLLSKLTLFVSVATCWCLISFFQLQDCQGFFKGTLQRNYSCTLYCAISHLKFLFNLHFRENMKFLKTIFILTLFTFKCFLNFGFSNLERKGNLWLMVIEVLLNI